jgi:N-sulfoglucosamine sulfohydrolase
MKNIQLIKLCIVGAPVFLTNACHQINIERPNIVLIIADDVSWNDLGCYGNNQVKTPNIDRLASEGLMFTNFFLTASSSSPSRNSIITGRYPHNTGASELHTEPSLDMVSFPELLKQSGYFTAQAGKFHMGKYALRGFESVNENGELNGDGGEEQWLSVLQSRPKEKPFFMWFASYDAHRNWGPNEFSGTHIPAGINPPFYLASGEKTKSDLAAYYDEIARLDSYIGQVEKELAKQGVLDNTVILIMADNGRPFPHSKTRVNDRGMKAPFIIHWPAGIGEKKEECAGLVSAIDIAPTILELASVKAPESIQGNSFKEVLLNPQQEFRTCVFAEHNWHDYEAHERMMRTKEFLYILNSRPQFANMGPADAVGSPSFGDLHSLKDSGDITPEQDDVFTAPRPSEELYDCKSDPEQLINIVSDPEYQQSLVILRQSLKDWMSETGDDIPANLTKDWYLREPGYQKTEFHGIRGESVSTRLEATKNNCKGLF